MSPVGEQRSRVPEEGRPSPIRAPSDPVSISVREDEDRRPVLVTLSSHGLGMTSIEDMREIVDEWWRVDPAIRRHFQVGPG